MVCFTSNALTEGAAEAGDEITADISAWIAANLLRNPGAQAVGEHAGGLPRHWDLRTDGALTASVAGHGAGFVDIRCKGSVGADTRVVLAFESPEGVPAAPGQRFAFMVELRQVAGTLPGDVVFALALEECAPGRVLHAHTGQVSPGLACFAAQTGADAALTHVRPAFHVGGAVREGVDFTIRVASPCLLSPAVLPATPHPAMRAEGFAWRLGEDGVMPGLDAGLVGMRPGATRRVSVTAPLRGAGLPAELAGRELVVDCRVQALRRLALPALDDEFATRAGQRDLAALRAAVGEELRAHCEASSARLLRLALLEHLAAMPAMLPRGLVDNESRLLAQRTPSGDAAALRSIAEQRLRLRMVLRKLGEGFGLAIAATDLEAALAQEAARFPGQEAEALAFLRRNAAAAQRVADQLWTQRVIDHALSLVEVRDRAVAPAVLREAAAALDARDAGLDD
ncbi:MAG: FKBP-type peptidyl-prolyl cis-trans isomerase [Pseudomonadota bacterium]